MRCNLCTLPIDDQTKATIVRMGGSMVVVCGRCVKRDDVQAALADEKARREYARRKE